MSKNKEMSRYSAMSVLIRMYFEDTHLASGTAFVYNNGISNFLVTARHNITGRNHETGDCLAGHGGTPNRLTVFLNKNGSIGEHVEVEISIYDKGKPIWKEHPTFGKDIDVVAIELGHNSDVDFLPYSSSKEYPPIQIGISERVSVIGFPFAISAGGLFAVWVNGFIASEPELDFGNRPTFLVDCRTRTGQSGSPVIMYSKSNYTRQDGLLAMCNGESARPIGIYTGRINSESDLGIVWKWSVVEQLCKTSLGNWGFGSSPRT